MSAREMAKAFAKGMFSAVWRGPAKEVRVFEWHYVDSTGSPLSVSPVRFRDQLVALKSAGAVALSAREFAARTVDPSLIKPGEVLLTFDDGFENFYTEAAPVLAEFGMAATVFVVSDLAGQRPSWLERDAARIETMRAAYTHSPAEQAAYEAGVVTFLKSRLMNWDEVAKLRAMGIDVQSHSATHPYLAEISPEQLADQLSRSKREIESRTGEAVELICYPYGNCDAAVTRAAEEAGYVCGFVSGRLNPGASRLEIGRTPMNGMVTARETRFRMSRAYDRYWRATQG